MLRSDTSRHPPRAERNTTVRRSLRRRSVPRSTVSRTVRRSQPPSAPTSPVEPSLAPPAATPSEQAASGAPDTSRTPPRRRPKSSTTSRPLSVPSGSRARRRNSTASVPAPARSATDPSLPFRRRRDARCARSQERRRGLVLTSRSARPSPR